MKQEECEDLEAQVDDALAEVRDAQWEMRSNAAVAATSRGGEQQLAALILAPIRFRLLCSQMLVPVLIIIIMIIMITAQVSRKLPTR